MSVPWGRLGSSWVTEPQVSAGWLVGSASRLRQTLSPLYLEPLISYGRTREGLWAEPGAMVVQLWTYLFDVVNMTAYLLSYVLRSNQGALVTSLRPTLKDLPQ